MLMMQSALGCAVPLPEGTPGQVLTVGADGQPMWAAPAATSTGSGQAGSGASGGSDICALDAEEVACLMNALDFNQLPASQIALLVQMLRGELVTDAFGVQLGYFLNGFG